MVSYKTQSTQSSATREFSTQTTNSLVTSAKPERRKKTKSITSTVSNKIVKTYVRYAGRRSARLRVVRPSSYRSPMATPRKIAHPTPKKSVAAKIDNKGIFIRHYPSPKKKVNHNLPDVERVLPKIDNRGIDIFRLRNSVANLRDAAASNEIERKVNPSLLFDIKSAMERKLKEIPPKPKFSPSIVDVAMAPRRFSISSGRSIRSRVVVPDYVAVKERKVSLNFMNQLRQIFQKKLQIDEMNATDEPPDEQSTLGFTNVDMKLSRHPSLDDDTEISELENESRTSTRPSTSTTTHRTSDIKDIEDFHDEESEPSSEQSEDDLEEHVSNGSTRSSSAKNDIGQDVETEAPFRSDPQVQREQNPDDFHSSSEDEESKKGSGSSTRTDSPIEEELPDHSHGLSADIDDLLRQNNEDFEAMRQNETYNESRISSSSSSNSTKSVHSQQSRKTEDVNDIDFDILSGSSFGTINSSHKTVKTPVELEAATPMTPKIVLEDYRNRSDPGYLPSSTKPPIVKSKRVSEESVQKTSPPLETSLEQNPVVPVVNPRSSSRASTTSIMEDKETFANFEESTVPSQIDFPKTPMRVISPQDGRPSYRLPQRQSSQDSVGFFSGCWSYFCDKNNVERDNYAENLEYFNQQSSQNQKVIVKEMNIDGVPVIPNWTKDE